MAHKIGKQTIIIDGAVGVLSSAAVGSKKEGEGPLGADFDVINEDSRFGEKTWEKAESKMQQTAAAALFPMRILFLREICLISALLPAMARAARGCRLSGFTAPAPHMPKQAR